MIPSTLRNIMSITIAILVPRLTPVWLKFAKFLKLQKGYDMPLIDFCPDRAAVPKNPCRYFGTAPTARQPACS
jgi:hypothetical protein